VSEWYNACSFNGSLAYPYGNTYDATQCVGLDAMVTAPVWVWDVSGNKQPTPPTANAPPFICNGGQLLLEHMSGDVAEWENSCSGDAGANDTCRLRGGSFQSGMNSLRCDADFSKPRSFSAGTIGFRCCL
jgi:formylglycine-generating enzyme required for sulfatase activity